MPPILIAALAAGICIVLCAGAAMLCIKTCGPALASVTSEKPELGSKLVIAIILGEALAIYGLLIAFMIIGRIPQLESDEQAMQLLVSGITMGSTALMAGIGISYCGPAMMTAAAEKAESFTTNMMGLVLSEALAIYGLLISFMIMG
jgi:F0F1-type ATP synthase membrane subunit c/vacuolar-type H+-ATPase subunit K